MNITEIEKLTSNYAFARSQLATIIRDLNAEIEAAKRKAIPAIKLAVARTADRQERLRGAIQSSPELFQQPRTQTFSGIKVGFRKGTGGIDWDDDEHVADLIKKHFPEQFDVLVKTTRKPQAKALSQLEVADLKKVACRVESTGDVIVIKPADSEVEKVVNALLKGATDEAQKEAA